MHRPPIHWVEPLHKAPNVAKEHDGARALTPQGHPSVPTLAMGRPWEEELKVVAKGELV